MKTKSICDLLSLMTHLKGSEHELGEQHELLDRFMHDHPEVTDDIYDHCRNLLHVHAHA